MHTRQVPREVSGLPDAVGSVHAFAIEGDRPQWARRYLLAFVCAEAVVRGCGVLPGSIAYAMVCFLLVNHQLLVDAMRGAESKATPVFLVLALAATARLAALATSGFADVWFGGYAFASLPTCAALWALGRARGVHLDLPCGKPSRQQLGVALAAVPLALLGFLASVPRASLDWWDLTWRLWLPVLLFAASGIVDEAFYQGLGRGGVGDALGTSGVGATALLYAVTHANVELGVLVALVGSNVLFGYLARRTGSLIGACTGHAALNVLLVFVLPYWWPH